MSAATIADIFDDSDDGVTDEGILEDAILDSESELNQVAQKLYGDAGLTWLAGLGLSVPRSVKRMCLDLFEVRAMRRHPQYIRSEWTRREESVQRDLKAWRLRELELATVDEPEAQNEGGEVLSGDPLNTTPPVRKFSDGLGIF